MLCKHHHCTVSGCSVSPKGNLPQRTWCPLLPALAAPDVLSVSALLPTLDIFDEWNPTIGAFLFLVTYICYYLKHHFYYLKGLSI